MSPWMAFEGAGMGDSSVTWRSSTLMLLPTETATLPHATGDTKGWRIPMSKELEMSSMPHSHLWSSQRQEDSEMRRRHSTRGLFTPHFKDNSFSSTMAWLRCHLTFSLLRSSIQCIRGARSHSGFPVRAPPVDLVRVEASLTSTSWTVLTRPNKHCFWNLSIPVLFYTFCSFFSP